MFPATTFSRLLPPGLLRLRRLLVVCLLSLLLHFLVVGWLDRHLRLAAPAADAIKLLRADLYVAPPPKPAVPPAAAPVLKKPRPVRPAKPVPVAAAATAPAQTAIAPPMPAPLAADAAAWNDDIEAAIANANTTPARQGIPADDATRLQVDPPPTAQLKYDVQALRNGDIVYGNGKINWDYSGSHYAVRGEAGILFFTLLSFGSEGVTDEFGLAPVIYNEKPFRKAEMATHFSRERNLISFSASTASYPIQGGEQDRASLIWQLAGIGRGDTEKFIPNAVFSMFVAGVRDGEPWHLQVVGEEEIEVGIGKLTTWHVVRMPRADSYDQRLDIWLAPQQHWYPVRLRYTYPNGDYLDMKASSINQELAR